MSSGAQGLDTLGLTAPFPRSNRDTASRMMAPMQTRPFVVTAQDLSNTQRTERFEVEAISFDEARRAGRTHLALEARDDWSIPQVREGRLTDEPSVGARSYLHEGYGRWVESVFRRGDWHTARTFAIGGAR